MIPLRVTLKGFMSYRDEATLHFDGASLHVLAGRNGAGKSTIFDAITFALYGVHRGGEQHFDDLINHQSDALLVEVDFAAGMAGDEVYRVRRTLTRRGRSTVQAFYVRGPNPPRPGTALPQTIPGTDSVRGFEKWVIDRIGLDDKTFCASVLLRQGQSDAMLQAKPNERHTMLSQLVDLSAYQKLHERARSRAQAAAGEERACTTQLAQLAPVDDQAIESLAADIEEKDAQIRRCQEVIEALAAAKVHAERWASLTAERDQLTQAMTDTADLLARSEEIESEASQHDELERVVPLLERLVQARDRLKRCVTEIERHDAAVREATEDYAGATASLEEARSDHASLAERHDRATQQLQAATDERLRLAGDLSCLSQLDKARATVAQLDEQLATFPADLDEQLAASRQERDQLDELRMALPWLSDYASARSAWQTADDALHRATAAAADALQRLTAAREALATLETAVTDADTRARQAQEGATEAETLHGEAQRALDRFHEVEHQPLCAYCGQELKPEHLEQERGRLEALLAEALETLRLRQATLEAASSEHHAAVDRVSAQRDVVQRSEDEWRSEATQAQQAERDRDQAVERGRHALATLPERYRTQVNPAGADDLPLLLRDANSFPRDVDLAALTAHAAAYDEHVATLGQLETKARERDQVQARQEQVADEVERLEAQYPEAQALTLRQTDARAATQEAEARAALEVLAEPLRNAVQHVRELQTAQRAADDRRREAAAAARTERARHEELAAAMAERKQELPGNWQPLADELTEARVEHFRVELGRLADAPAAREQLHDAQRQDAHRRERLHQVEQEIDQVPPDARRPVAEIDAEAAAVTGRRQVADQERQAKLTERQHLQQRRDQRTALEQQRRDAARQARLCGLLAEWLGRDRLQRHLLRRAERGIVACANEVLDRISSGTLRLELRADQENAPDGAPKALDLIAFNTATGSQPMPVHNLSGSQRFRVAVSLALGIGRWYADGGGRRAESVIIDEGFGSLDKEGRREMIDELHNLRDVLKRIILVSHQEQFTSAFKHGYEIRLENGTSVGIPL